MELKDYLRVILKGWWLILSAFLVSVASALVFSYSQTPIYSASATFVVSPGQSLSQSSEFMQGVSTLSKRDGIMSTYVEIAQSKAILSAARNQIGLTPDQLEHLSVSSELIPATNVIIITVEADDPKLAKAYADLIGQKTIEYVKQLYEPYDMKPLDAAPVPVLPSKPNIQQNTLVAAVIGLVIGVGLAFLLEYIRPSIQTINLAGVSIIDGNTGSYNRHYLLQRLGEELSRAKRHGHPLSLALLNIEHLDAVSNTHLPHLRNEALRRVNLFLKEHAREEDVVARFEGDKFALLLPDTPGSEAERILEKLQTRLEWTLFEMEESKVKLNLSATSGIAAYNLNGTDRDELLVQAETALQCAGNSGSKIHLFKDNGETDTHPDEVTDQ